MADSYCDVCGNGLSGLGVQPDMVVARCPDHPVGMTDVQYAISPREDLWRGPLEVEVETVCDGVVTSYSYVYETDDEHLVWRPVGGGFRCNGVPCARDQVPIEVRVGFGHRLPDEEHGWARESQ